MLDRQIKKTLVKIILTLENNHHGCKEEAVNLAKQALGYEIEHNEIREMINQVSDEKVETITASIKG